MTSEHAESVNYLSEIIGKVLENFELLSNIRAIHNENLSSCKECGKSFKNIDESAHKMPIDESILEIIRNVQYAIK